MKDFVEQITKRIKESKERVARERDKIRLLHDDLGDLLETYDRGIEELEEGLRNFKSGVEVLSEFIE